MKILMLNQDWFAREFRAAGHQVVTAGLANNLEIQIETPLIHLTTILNRAPAGFAPDVVMVHDDSGPLMVVGLEELSCPMAFYSVDAHHHAELHSYLGNLFDHVFIAQKDYSSVIEERSFIKPEWLPLWAPDYVEAAVDKRWDTIFVGTLNAKLNPARVAFFDALRQRVPLECRTGNYREFFPYADIVVNQTVKSDLNFRVFEAMMCGATLLTEESGNGLTELFTPDTHLVTYRKNDVDHAEERIKALLADRQRCREIAAAGRAEILSRHCSGHRAARVLEVLLNLKRRHSPLRLSSMTMNYQHLATGLQDKDTALTNLALAHCLRLAREAALQGEPMDEVIAFNILRAALNFDRFCVSQNGLTMLYEFEEAFPQIVMFKAAKIRGLLNSGRKAEAAQVAAKLAEGPPEPTFAAAERAVNIALAWGNK